MRPKPRPCLDAVLRSRPNAWRPRSLPSPAPCCPARHHPGDPRHLRGHLERTSCLFFGQDLGHHVQVSGQQVQVRRDTELRGALGRQGMGDCDYVTEGQTGARVRIQPGWEPRSGGSRATWHLRGKEGIERTSVMRRTEQMLACRVSNSTACRRQTGNK